MNAANEDNKFEIEYKNQMLRVERHSISDQVVFRVVFPDKRQPLVLHRALTNNATRFWTSIPEGRQKEAEEIGTLISEYYKSNT